MRSNKKVFRALMPILLIALVSSVASAGLPQRVHDATASAPTVSVTPGFTRVLIPTADQPAGTGVPIPLPAPVPIGGLPKVKSVGSKLQQVQCPASSEPAACGGSPQTVTYWWQGTFWVGSRAGTWYEFVQEFEWRVTDGRITMVTLNMCYSRNGSWHYHGCGGHNEHDGSPRIVQSNSSTVRVLAAWDYHFHQANEYQQPDTDIRFGADGSIVGTVWYQ